MTELMKRYEAETGDNSQIVWHGGSFASDDYIAWLEAKVEVYDRLMSGGKQKEKTNDTRRFE